MLLCENLEINLAALSAECSRLGPTVNHLIF